jgi:hypothetical protein
VRNAQSFARHLSVFGSALITGEPDFPIAEIPFQDIVDRVADGTYRTKPAKAHRLIESSAANGKIVVRD